MTYEENVRAILESNFAGSKEEIIDTACKNICQLRYIPQDMTEEVCEAFINLTKRIIEILPDLIASVTANMPKAIEQYIESKRGEAE